MVERINHNAFMGPRQEGKTNHREINRGGFMLKRKSYVKGIVIRCTQGSSAAHRIFGYVKASNLALGCAQARLLLANESVGRQDVN